MPMQAIDPDHGFSEGGDEDDAAGLVHKEQVFGVSARQVGLDDAAFGDREDGRVIHGFVWNFKRIEAREEV